MDVDRRLDRRLLCPRQCYLAPTIGTGLAVVIVLLGLMAGSLAIDQFGWLGAKRNPVTALQLIGLLVMILGVACIRLL